MAKFDRILIIDLSGIGDIILSVPAIRAVRKSYPTSRITALITPRAVDVLKDCPYLDELETLDISVFKKLSHIAHLNKMGQAIKMILNLRGKKFDVAVNLYQIATSGGHLRMKVLFFLLNPKMKVGRDTDGRGDFYDVKVKGSFFDTQHEVEKKLEIVQMMNVDIQEQFLELWVQEEKEQEIFSFLRQAGIDKNRPIIGINPGSMQQSKLWSKEKFAQVADCLIEKYNMQIIFLGAPNEVGQVQKILALMKKMAINFAGQLTLGQYIALTKNMNYFITLDSAPMHIASVFQIPTIALFGPGQPLKFGPYANKKAKIVQKESDCSPCRKMECEEGLCMEQITVQDVLTAFEELI